MPIEEMYVDEAVKNGTSLTGGVLSPAMGEMKECLFQLIGALRSKNASQAPVSDALTILLYGALKSKNENEILAFCVKERYGEFSPFVLNLSMLSKTDTACKSVLVEMQQVFSGECYSMALVNKINTEKKRNLFFRKNHSMLVSPEGAQLEAKLEEAKEVVKETEQFCLRYMLKA